MGINLGDMEGVGTGIAVGPGMSNGGGIVDFVEGDVVVEGDTGGEENEATNTVASVLKKGCLRSESQSMSKFISTTSHCSFSSNVHESPLTDSLTTSIRATSSTVSSRASHTPPSPSSTHNLLHNTWTIFGTFRSRRPSSPCKYLLCLLSTVVSGI